MREQPDSTGKLPFPQMTRARGRRAGGPGRLSRCRRLRGRSAPVPWPGTPVPPGGHGPPGPSPSARRALTRRKQDTTALLAPPPAPARPRRGWSDASRPAWQTGRTPRSTASSSCRTPGVTSPCSSGAPAAGHRRVPGPAGSRGRCGRRGRVRRARHPRPVPGHERAARRRLAGTYGGSEAIRSKLRPRTGSTRPRRLGRRTERRAADRTGGVAGTVTPPSAVRRAEQSVLRSARRLMPGAVAGRCRSGFRSRQGGRPQ